MLTPQASDWSRKVWLGVIMGLYPLFQLLGAPCLAASPIAMGASRC